MIDVTILGYIAAFCTTCSFVPQVLHILKTGDTASISLAMYSCFVLGVFLWLIYGIAMQDWPIIIANAITLMLASMILLLKIRDVLRARKTPQLSV
ncbi:glutathione synthetase [Vibrio ichthyoenteri ATCC 700023]|uniref:Glutathione synthetase n=1 Tax=Vibrio ichthyoenteri ATCC 700023 TaxID=870968 RepID=F9RWQ0_9VIBR|nr:SemiSWEET transporter [Vibrio ichthyoenteri]EGU49108.1 glutathione synthetase [Vibrio ichthyoenteri ATCC 700023]